MTVKRMAFGFNNHLIPDEIMSKIVWLRIIAFLSFIALIFAVYGQVLHFDFVNIDDSVYVFKNTNVLYGISLNSIKWAFTSTDAGFWHPVTWVSLMLDAQFYGFWAGGYHLTNLMLHAASSLLLFIVFFKMTGDYWKSLLVAVLFAIHPLHVEPVAWVSARKDVLSAFWGMFAIYAYVFYVQSQSMKRYALVLVFFLLGLMSKPMLVTLPFVLLLLDYWPLRRMHFGGVAGHNGASQTQKLIAAKPAGIQHLILEKIPLFLLVVPISMITYVAEHQLSALPSMQSFPLDLRVYNAIVSYVWYLEKTVLPLNLSVYYPHPVMWPVWRVFFSGSVIVLISILVIRKFDRAPHLAVGWLWYLGMLVPVIGFIQVGSHAVADRYSYLPLTGLFVALAWGVPALMIDSRHKMKILGVGSVLLVVLFSFLSWQRCQLWRDNFALWNDFLAQYNIFSPDNIKKNYQVPFAYNFRGTVYAERGNYHKAIEDYNAALEINAIYEEVLNNRAISYSATGQNDLAFKDYEQALKIKPDYADAYYNRGLLYNKIGWHDMAISDFTSAIKFDSSMADAFVSRGIAFGSQSQYNLALNDFNQALAINRNLYQAYFNRGIVYNISQQYDLAAANFSEVLRLKPDNAEAHKYMGEILAKTGRYEEAETHRKKALHVKAD